MITFKNERRTEFALIETEGCFLETYYTDGTTIRELISFDLYDSILDDALMIKSKVEKVIDSSALSLQGFKPISWTKLTFEEAACIAISNDGEALEVTVSGDQVINARPFCKN